jgi:hypothetical protein
METPSNITPTQSQLTDITGLRLSGIFPTGKEPSIRTLRDWTKLRRIPHHRLGHFVYYDPVEVSVYIRTKLKVPARG